MTSILSGYIASDTIVRDGKYGEWAASTLGVEKDSGAEYVDLVAFGPRADLLTALRKGQEVVVEGHVEDKTWIDREGEIRHRDRMKVSRIRDAESHFTMAAALAHYTSF
jgi:single-stranded DNA-binding protein